MLPPDAFLRNAPRIIDLESRLVWEVIVSTSDAVNHSYLRLINTLTRILDSNVDGKIVEELKSEICVDCWSIVDQTHAFMRIVESLNRKPNGKLDNFMVNFKSKIYKFRNKIKHISQNIKNLSKKTSSNPVYGSLAFMSPLQSDLKVDVISFSLGGFQFNEETGCVIDPTLSPQENQISNVLFCSFGETVNISNLYSCMSDVVSSINETSMQQAQQKIKSFSIENKFDFDQIMKETVKGGVIIRAKIDYSLS